MRILTLIAGLFLTLPVFAMNLQVVTRKNLRFSNPNLQITARASETFEIDSSAPEYEALVKESALKVIALLPEQYQTGNLTINIESSGTFIDPTGFEENIPLSVLLSVEMPEVNQIRICNHELKTDLISTRSLVSHEVGHVIISRLWDASGKIEHGDWAWKKSIYEGVADYIAATATNQTSGGTNWWDRDVLRYKSFEEANKQTLLATVEAVKAAYAKDGLLKFRSYQNLISSLEAELSELPTPPADSNAIGSWLAGQLWLLNQEYGKDKVLSAVFKIALTGDKKSDPQAFVEEVRNLLTR
ncbi:MAG: hypothetical protein J7501_07595 [Bdellovibrio sp.]|nr:hypothetical protein [Bdellovibrio sp.]